MIIDLQHIFDAAGDLDEGDSHPLTLAREQCVVAAVVPMGILSAIIPSQYAGPWSSADGLGVNCTYRHL